MKSIRQISDWCRPKRAASQNNKVTGTETKESLNIKILVETIDRLVLERLIWYQYVGFDDDTSKRLQDRVIEKTKEDISNILTEMQT